MNGILNGITKWRTLLQEAARADMHRIACGMTGVALPTAPIDRPACRPANPILQFSHRRSQLLVWRVLHR